MQHYRHEGANRGRNVLLTMLSLERELAVTGSPSTVGMRLLKTFQQQGEHEDWQAFPFRWSKVTGDLIVQRPLTTEEQRMGYLQKMEKNGAYLRAAVAEKLGVGTPVHLSDPEQLVPDFDASPAQPLPCAPWDGGEWMVTPILTLLRALE